RRNCLAKEAYAHQRSLLTAEQLEYQYAQQREAYRLCTEAESSEQIESINQLPELLISLLTGEDSRSCNFRKDI
ncbi:19540_t:CDS:2, partial [Racocetra fulgida]